MDKLEKQWQPFLDRYENGEWRAPVFRDMILVDIERFAKNNSKLTLLDIGCGSGFDCDGTLQRSLAQLAWRYIGVEPDREIQLGNVFTETFRCPFEDAQIEQDSIDVAFAVMVLEHFEHPEVFWRKLYRSLKNGGVFWGFTVDARHWFVYASVIAEKMKIKDWYLDKLHGVRGTDRYENYSVFYRCNTPQRLRKQTNEFSSSCVFNFNRVGQMDYYFPESMRWMNRIIDRLTMALGGPGGIMAIRIEK